MELLACAYNWQRYSGAAAAIAATALLAIGALGCSPSARLEPAAPPEADPEIPAAAVAPPPPPPAPSPAEVTAAAQKRIEGLESRSRGDLSAAIAAFEEALALDPTHLNGAVILGWTLHLDGQRERATAVLSAATARDPDFVPALNALGIVYLVAGNLDAAVTTHSRAAELDATNEIAFYNLSLAYEGLGQLDRAIAAARRATELEPGNPHPWVALALAHWSNRDGESAREFYRQAIALDGRYRSADYLAHLRAAGFSPEQVSRSRALLAALM